MTTRKIIFVPGKNPKPEPTLHHSLLSRCLLHGVSKQNNKVAIEIEQQQAFELCAWNHTFYQQYDDIENQLPWIDRLLEKSSADKTDRHQAGQLRVKLMRLLYQVVDAHPWLIKLVANEHVKNMLDGSSQYFENQHGLADQVRHIVKQAIQASHQKGEKLLIIAHSMGSIISYDSLYELMFEDKASGHNTKQVDLLLTVGSPLGLNYTQQRLLSFNPKQPDSFPNNIRHWKNISACSDLVSVDKTVADDFSSMLEHGLIDSIEDYTDNIVNWYKNNDGYNAHRSYGYLVNPCLSKIIVDWWTS